MLIIKVIVFFTHVQSENWRINHIERIYGFAIINLNKENTEERIQQYPK